MAFWAQLQIAGAGIGFAAIWQLHDEPAVSADGDGLIVRPFSPSALLQTARRVLERDVVKT